jgi:choline dehydrogenase-like flavoprotein
MVIAPIATGGYPLVCQFKSSPDLERPDIQGMFAALALDNHDPAALALAQHSGVTFLGYQIRPTTTSSVHISGRLPANKPIIDVHVLEAEVDRKATAPTLATVRQLFSSCRSPTTWSTRTSLDRASPVLRRWWSTPGRRAVVFFTPPALAGWDRTTMTSSTRSCVSAV